MRATVLLLVLGCALAPLCAQTTYWSENFDSYPTGQLASGTGGWFGWDNVPTVMGDIVAGPALSPSNSLQINASDDTVYPWSLNDPTGYPRACQWRLTAMWYIDSTLFTAGSGNQYFILNNVYNHGGPQNWSLQLRAVPGTMLVSDADRGGSTPVVVDTWVLVQVDIDLDNNTIAVFYNNMPVSTGLYTVGGGAPEIANLDLYSDITSNVSYYDDIALVRMTPVEYQMNSAAASLDLDGVQTLGCAPAIVNKNPTICGGVLNPDPVTLNVASSNATGVFEIMYNFVPLVPGTGGGFILPGGQILNLNFFGGLNWLAGGLSPAFQPVPPGGSASISLSFVSNLDGSIQGLFTDPASPFGFTLTEGTELHVAVTGPAASAPGPTGDDTFVNIDVTSAPYCWTTAGIPFYGTFFNSINVVSNGRVQFGINPSIVWSPTAAQAISDDPSANFWSDLQPNVAGSITATSPAPDVVRVDWVGVPFWGQAGTSNTFAIEFDATSGLVTLDGIQGFGTNATDSHLLGLSPGILMAPATDPGPVNFSPPGAGSPGLVSDMLYDFAGAGATLPTILGGVTQVLFAPSTVLAPNYDWASL